MDRTHQVNPIAIPAGEFVCSADMKRIILRASVAVALIITAGIRAEPLAGPTPGLVSIQSKPLYQFSGEEVRAYLHDLHSRESGLTKRMIEIARKNIGQPYELYLLGEAPFETIDNQPLYCLGKSDCVVFVEHTLAMALTDNFDGFVRMLQRIRYGNGKISLLTRNHYTEADWNKNNAWLAREITDELAGADVVKFSQVVDRQKFFKNRNKLDTQIAVQTIHETFIPYDRIESVKSKLREGDIVNFVSGRNGGYWVGHVGLVALDAKGEVNLIHSTPPQVREESIGQYIARATRDNAEKDAADKARFHGFKFLRPVKDPLSNLRAIDGSDAPKVTVPSDSKISFDAYLKTLRAEEAQGAEKN